MRATMPLRCLAVWLCAGSCGSGCDVDRGRVGLTLILELDDAVGVTSYWFGRTLEDFPHSAHRPGESGVGHRLE
jgi:hypothetical protein